MPIIKIYNTFPKFQLLEVQNDWLNIPNLEYLFLKQLPPNQGPESRNFAPIRESVPIALATSLTSAPVASHKHY